MITWAIVWLCVKSKDIFPAGLCFFSIPADVVIVYMIAGIFK